MAVSNEEIAQLFENMGTLLEMKGDTVFKVRAYQRAARTISRLSFSLAQAVQDGTDLKQIPGIGTAINDKIHELLGTGRVSAYGRLVAELPGGVLRLMDIPGIGPKTAMLLTQELDISTIEEVDIRADGTLDYPDGLLEQLDVVVASVHSAMGQDSGTMTQRIIRATRHPAVTIIGHPSTRLLGRREPVEFDPEALLQTARETGTALEVNSSPERLDLKDTHAHRARELGVPLVISTDSHHYGHLDQRRFGVGVVRRAWCEPQHILNTMPLDQFLAFIRTPKPARSRVFGARLIQAG